MLNLIVAHGQHCHPKVVTSYEKVPSQNAYSCCKANLAPSSRDSISEHTGSENTVMNCHCFPTFSHVPSLYQDTVQWAVCLAHHL